MLAAERLGQVGDLHHVLVNLGDDVTACGVVAYGHQPDSFDQNHFRGVTVFCLIGFDLLSGRFENSLGAFAVDIDVVRFAIDDDVGREGFRNLCEAFFRLDEIGDQLVINDLERFESLFTACHHADGRDDLLRAGANIGLAHRCGLGQRFFDLAEHFVVNSLYLLGRFGPDEDTVVLEQDDRRFVAVRLGIFPDAAFHLFEKDVARIDIGNIERFVAEEFLGHLFHILRTHQPVDERRVQVDDETCAQRIVQRRFDARAAILRDAGGGQVVFDLFFARGRIRGILLLRNDVQFVAVEYRKPLFGDRRERVPASFHPQLVSIFVRGIASAGDHIAAVGAVELRYAD